ncbi:MAG: hypothetical protein JNM66_04975 [Bryobacterales bacterium]|nr:hypothetical protein [Bryobacterales bacterium]
MNLRIALLAAAACCAAAQPYQTRVAMDALMDIRFFHQQGNYMMATSIPVLFPPPGETKARLLIKKAGGGAVVTKNMIIEPWPPHNAFGNLKAADGLMGFGPIGAGDYVMSVEMGGKEISAYKFSVAAEKGADPFDPSNELVRTGPWSKTAFLIGPTKDAGDNIQAGIWLSTREFPGYAPKKQIPYTLHLMNAGKQVALVEGVVSEGPWNLFKPEFMRGHGLGPVKWATLIGTPGAYTLELRAAGKTIRSYKFSVAGGKIARIPQSELGYEGTDSLPPQSLLSDARKELFWLAPIQ